MSGQEWTLPISVDRLIPHRPPMLLVDRLMESDGEKARVEVTLRKDHLLLDAAGALEPVALIEILAQSYAAMKGLSEQKANRPVRDGFLVALRKLKILGRAQVGDLLTIEVSTIGEFDFFTLAEGKVYRGDECLAQSQISLWIPDVIGEEMGQV
jgi:3-hydroxyacyl-[acyl-carrier-protein] dehydratase